MVKKFYIIAPVSSINKRPRLAKIVTILIRRGYEVEFFGWERVKDESINYAHQSKSVSEKVILSGGGYVSSKTRMMYPLWMMVVFFKCFSIGRGKRLYCLGWETAFPGLLASFITQSKIIFDDADRISMIVKLPIILKKAIVFLEMYVSNRVLIHIVPSLSRYNWNNSQLRVLKNTPLSTDMEGVDFSNHHRPKGDMILYANGWIGFTRGAPIFLELMNRFSKRDINIRMITAGWTDCREGHELFAHEKVVHYGEVSIREAHSLYTISDIVLTYYDPSVEINKYAESNKWGDCIMFGKKFIVNSEVETAREYIENDFAISCPYSNVSQLEEIIVDLMEERKRTRGDALRDNHEKPEIDYFDTSLIRIFDSIGV